ncbi:cell wall-binding repeat-containing protein [Peptostreptococcus stomatis]|uniref:cell wall-binding repeat-containing protein n=1 Tax=Peptostreptococcus stomatis TaxID=341694 RepID=UPI0028F101D4|nr:cell wall-binding repeat-containing protein [Peptostreptococcus stomatis]
MKKVVNVLLATTLATSSIAVLPNAALADSAGSTVERIGGINRYETCVNISKKSFDNSDVAILASGQKVHDALTSGGIAAKLKAPLLLTKKDTLPNVVMDELKRLKVKRVIFVGGEQSISKSLENQLAKTFKVQRVSGKDRYETSIKLAEELNKGSKQENIIVNANTVDALSAGPVAAKLNRSIILTDGKNLPEGSKSIVDINSSSNVIIGGTDSMNIKGLKGDRISGINRYETSTKIAEKYYQGNNDKVVLANGTNYIDALSAINLVLSKKAPVLLAKTDALDASVSKYLEKNAKGAYLLGGEDSISASLSKSIEKTIKDAQSKGSKRTDDRKNENKKPDNKKPEDPIEYDEVKVLKDGKYEVEAEGFSKLATSGKNNKLIATVENGKIKDIEFEYNDTNTEAYKNPFGKNRDKLFEKLKNNNYFLDKDKADNLKELNTIADKLYKLIKENPALDKINEEGIKKINDEHKVDIVTSATYSTASLYKGSHDLIKKINDAAEIKKVPRPKKTDKLNLLSKENFAKLDENTKYEDGVYYGDGFGFIGSKPIPLKVTVTGGKIEKVEFEKNEVLKVAPSDKYPELPDDGQTFIHGYNGAINAAKAGQINRLNYFLKSARDAENKVMKDVDKSTNVYTVEAFNKVLDDIFSKHVFGTQKLRIEEGHVKGSILQTLRPRLNYLTRTYMNEDLDYRYKVDTISGATYTATGTIEAIANALKKADPSVDFTNLTIPEKNGLQPSYKGGSEIDFEKIGFKAEMLKKGQTKPIDVPFKDFEKHGIKLCYVDHSTGELKEIKDKLKLTKENLGYDTKNGLALRLVHEKTNTVKLIKSIQIFDNTKIQCTVEKVQVSEFGKNNWKDVNGFNNKLDPKSQQLDFNQKLTMPEETSNSLIGKKIEFRLVTKREDNKSEKIFNLKSDSVIEWPTFNDSGYYALSIDKSQFTSGDEQYKLDQAGINNFRFAFEGIKSGEFKDAVKEFEKKGYRISEQTITLDRDYANENNMAVIEKLAKEQVNANFIKAAFPSAMKDEGKKLLESANVEVDNTEIANAFKNAANKSQVKIDVKLKFVDGSSYKFKLPIYLKIKKGDEHLQLKFEKAIQKKNVQIVQKIPTTFKANNETSKKNIESLSNKYGQVDIYSIADYVKQTYGSADDKMFVEKVEIEDSEISKIDTTKAGIYKVKSKITLTDSDKKETKGVFDIPFEVVKYQVVGFKEGYEKRSEISKLEYGPEENISIARDKGKNPLFFGYWMNYSNELSFKDGQWNAEKFNLISVNSLDDLKLFSVGVVKGDKDTYTKDEILDLSKPAKDILDADKPTKLYLYNFGESKNNNHPQKILIGEFTLKQ